MIIDAHIHIGKWSKVFFNYESTVKEAIDVMKSSGVIGCGMYACRCNE